MHTHTHTHKKKYLLIDIKKIYLYILKTCAEMRGLQGPLTPM